MHLVSAERVFDRLGWYFDLVARVMVAQVRLALAAHSGSADCGCFDDPRRENWGMALVH